ncbi:hypothetical protein RFI_06608 [Reticulomyxa filosa]|uniref:Uncharacterized protein n=1 Tax=Reticulomyxa filosa TaxID=46433 RepID=X6NX98_RETFI|nr:hypothetical protein RFI_06608 [Reticulomyxa filosa]|eukprot:ETO30513.1 hypothetical protein RFI_06608 [Reticulomyxa filosa]
MSMMNDNCQQQKNPPIVLKHSKISAKNERNYVFCQFKKALPLVDKIAFYKISLIKLACKINDVCHLGERLSFQKKKKKIIKRTKEYKKEINCQNDLFFFF